MFLILSPIPHQAVYCAGLPFITACRARQLHVFECRLQDVEHPAVVPLGRDCGMLSLSSASGSLYMCSTGFSRDFQLDNDVIEGALPYLTSASL